MQIFKVLLLILAIGLPTASAEAQAQDSVAEPDRAATGGAQTLEDILRRQQGLNVDDQFRRDATGAPTGAPSTDQLGTLGGASDPELWRALRFGTADVTASNSSPGATLLMQDSGTAWLEFREGPLRTWGGYALLGMIGLLVLFRLLRGKIMIEAGPAGTKIERFNALERFAHWLLAGSFILLGITGLIVLFGRNGLMDWIGKEAYSTLAEISKWVHNNVSWAFMLALVLVFFLWVLRNIPHTRDLVWLMKGGGLFSKHSHPPAGKFNAGQKLIFWSVIVLGASVSASGLALLFPFELPMFGKTFVALNQIGAPGWIGMDPLPEQLTPHAEMQLASAWHGIVAFAMIVIIIAHIYIGSVGMEGAFDAMGDGQVDLNWAKEHHSLWVEEVQAEAKTAPKGATPAE
ncbi:MAG: formate dehydrogenase subunit gamma [Rhodobacter sp.]|nr:formate dehydrogenase subunit gamma [Rhodobacter sp.]